MLAIPSGLQTMAALGGQVPEDARHIARVTIDLLEAASRAGNDARARKTG